MEYWFSQFPSHPELKDTAEPNADSWNLVWSEQFTGSALNPAVWNLLDDPYGFGERSQHYKPENIEISSGMMNIQAKEEQSQGFPYTSGSVTTKGKIVFKYGKLEVRAKLPAGRGLLPAIWLWNNKGTEFPEIDIVEMLGQEPGQLWNVVHYDKNGVYGRDYNTAKLPDLTADYHTYGLEWYPEKLIFLVDGEPVFTSTEYVPQEYMYLFINLGVGGNWVGEPDESTIFPATMSIDWIRYYQK